MTVKDVCDNFLAAWQPTVRKRTFKVRAESFLLHLRPIEDIEVEDLTADILIQHIKTMRDKMHASTVSQWQGLLKRCFAYAKHHRKIEKDITEQLLCISYKSKRVAYITPKQFYALVEEMKTFTTLEDLEEKILFLETLFLTGIRHSECRALQVFKFNFAENTVLISNAIYSDQAGVWELTDPKTETSFRVISVPEYHMEKIKCFVEKNRKKPEDFLFSYPDGTPRIFTFAKWPLEKAGKRLGIKISTHGLRHSHATFLRQSGLDLEKIQKRLGHANVLTTIHYSHAKLDDEDVVDVIKKVCYPLSRGEENERNKNNEFNL